MTPNLIWERSDLQKDSMLGPILTFAGLGLLIGNPIAGALLDLENAVLWKAQLFSALTVVVGSAFSIILRLIKWKHGERWKI